MEERKVTEGGYEYITDQSGHKIRNTISPQRLTEDDETYDEYKIRRKLVNNLDRKRTVWYSKEWGTNNATNRLKIYEALLQQAKEQVEENKEEKV